MPRLSEKARKNKVAYNMKRNKMFYKLFTTSIKIEEYNEIMELLGSIGMNKAEFVRWAYEELKKKKG